MLSTEQRPQQVVTELRDWPSDRARRASVNNFGYGGTNAHVILEDLRGARPLEVTDTKISRRSTPKLVLLSARSEISARRMASGLCSHLQQYDGTGKEVYSLDSLAYTLSQRRSRFPWTIALSASSISQLADLLACEDNIRPIQAPDRKPRLGFIFNGQGAQWHAMGRRLMNAYPTYLRTLEACDAAIARYGAAWSVVEELRRDEENSRVDEVEFSMPLTCAVQLGLVRLLGEWGVEPTAVAGHSTGEVAAAFTAGALSLEEAMAVTFFRGLINARQLGAQASQGQTGIGGMLAVGLGPAEAEPYIADLVGSQNNSYKVVIACFNSPSSVTLSGDMIAIDLLKQRFDDEGIFARKLKVQAAFHSHHMLPLAEAYEATLVQHMAQGGRECKKAVTFLSTVTGTVLKDPDQLGPANWVQNMIRPVQFAQALHSMIHGFDSDQQTESNVDFVVELGAHGALAGPVRQLLSQPQTKHLGITYGSCLDRGKDDVMTIQTLMGRLIQHGYPVDVSRINSGSTTPDGEAAGLVAIPTLPSYPWNHATSFWAEPRPSHAHRLRKHAPHPLIGTRLPIVSDRFPVWRNVVRCSELPWLRDHVVQSQIVFPGAGYICMAIEAMRQEVVDEVGFRAGDICGFRLRDVDLCKAVVVPREPAANVDEGVEMQISLELPDERSMVRDWRRFRICAVPDKAGSWELIASGLIAVVWQKSSSSASENEGAVPPSPIIDSPGAEGALPSSDYRRKIKPRDLFKALKSNGIHHGPLFQNLKGDILLGEGTCSTIVAVADPSPELELQNVSGAYCHPTTLDSLLVGAYASRHASSGSLEEATTAIPKSIKSVYISRDVDSRPGSKLVAHFATRWHSKGGFAVSATAHNEQEVTLGVGPPVVEIEDLQCQSVGAGHLHDEGEDVQGALPTARDQLCLVTDWKRSFSLNDPASLAQSLSRKAAALPGNQVQVEEEIGLDRDLERAAYYCVSDTLRQLTTDDIDGLEWHHRRLYDWMLLLERRAAGNELGPRSARWAASSEGSKQMLLDKVEKSSVTGALAMRVGRALLAILRKQTAPLELMLKEQLLYTFYQDCMHFPRATAHAGSLVKAMAEERPRLRILEIGAGTGGCTLPVLQALSSGAGGGSALPLFEHYTFTDISMGFFETARQKLAAWGDSISYNALNVEQDPAEQGFEPGSYDVIIAAQVLHATKNIKRTMENVRWLLKDGGKLILVETIRDTAYLHLIFGTLPGWWLSEEPERQFNPNMPVEAWDKTLRDTGFSGVEANVWDCEDQDHRALACILSSAVASRASPPLLSKTATLLYDSKEPPPSAWTRELTTRFSEDLGLTMTTEMLSPTFVPDGRVCLFISGIHDVQRWPFDESMFASIKTLVTRSKGLLWITTGSAVECKVPENALHQGLLRTARLEDTSKRYVTLDLDPADSPWAQTDSIIRVYQATMSSGLTNPAGMDFEYARRSSELLVPRIYPDIGENAKMCCGLAERGPQVEPFVQADGSSLRMVVDTPGLVDSIVFRSDPDAGQPLPAGWVEVEPYAYGLNFHDIMTVMGMLSRDVQEIGSECSGIVTRIGPCSKEGEGTPLRVGDRVCGLLAHGHFATRVRVPWTWMVKIPDSMPFEMAASFPLVFVTAYHSLFDAGRCEPDDKVLIHAASGGVGQACIILARWKGVPVGNLFVTAGTPEKRNFLIDEYGLRPGNVFSSRDETFVPRILGATDGQGVDIVVNSLSGKLLHESFHLVAPLGRFVEIGKRDIDTNKSLEMEPFQKALSFIHVDVIQLCDSKGTLIQRMLREMVSLVAEKAVPNVTPVTVTPLSDVVRTFRTMQTGKHMGKLVLTVGSDDVVKVSHTYPFILLNQPTSTDKGLDPWHGHLLTEVRWQTIKPPITAQLRPDATYVIVGGASGIGLSVARYFVSRGARTVLVSSRNATKRSEAPVFRQFSQEAALRGVNVVLRDCDLVDAEATNSLVRECRGLGLPEIRGVVYGGMVLDDAIIEHMDFAQWWRALSPKLHGTRNMADALGDGLDFLVVLSSLCGVWGNPSQANYAAGNAYQDALARHRSSRGLPAVTIDLGAVEAVGYVANATDDDVGERLLRNSGHRPLTEAETIGLIDYAIRYPRRASARTAQIASGMSGGGAYALHDARFSMMVQQVLKHPKKRTAESRAQGEGVRGLVSMYEQIATAPSPDAAARSVQSALVSRISDMFAIPEAEVDPRKPLTHFGVDSLVAVELRNWIVPNARVELTIFELLNISSLADLAVKVVKLARPIF